MSGAKETPRQKMIGMMYLVYTALLAMNVSADILDAFAIVNDGQEKTNALIEVKNNEQYAAFQQQLAKDQSQQTIDFYAAAEEIREKTTEIINYIEKDVKLNLLMEVEGLSSEEDLLNPKDPTKPLIRNIDKVKNNKGRVYYELELNNVGKRDDYDVPTTVMIEGGKATELKNKINEYREYIVGKISDLTKTDYSHKVGLLTDYDQDGNKIVYRDADQEVSWETKNFNHMIFVAEIALLNKIVGEIQTTEYDAVSHLMSRIGATDFKFNKLQARVIANRDYILQGEEYQAEVFLVASDTTRNFRAYYALGKGNQIETTSEGGVIRLKFKGNTLGEQKYSGVIKMTNPETGEEDDYEFEKTFTVAQPTATIAATKMNVMYSGLANPISISAPGYTPDEINVRVTGGTLKTVNKTKGEYEVTPTSVKEEVHVYATVVKDGKSTTLCDKPYRVKPVPTPQAKIGGLIGGDITKGKMLEAGKIEADLPDFDFGGFEYAILSYEYSYSYGGTNTPPIKITSGASFDSRIKKDIRAADRGQRFYFENIKAKAPDGTIVDLSSIILNIK